jgi:beta-galactosidase
MQLGVAYYPDYLYPGQLARGADGTTAQVSVEEHIALDIERMRRLGLRIIRMGEFSWAHVEPKPGEVDFRRFLHTLDLAQKAGLSAILCTPTATPPKWFVDQHPDTLPVDRQGRTIPFGGRRHYDPASETFRAASRRITTLFAKALGKHPAVIGWQTDNEIGNHSSWQSFTKAAQQQFRAWLRQRYAGDIDALNEAWFTCFWSMAFRDFDEIDLPVATWTAPNPHLELDFRRFMSEVNRSFQKEQLDILREHSPGRFMTHNITPMLFELDLWDFCADLDRVGYDHYQMAATPDPVSSSSQFALMRSLRQGRPFLVLEQQPLQVNWQRVNRRFAMDWLLLWGAQAAFQGAEAMLYFSWRRFKGGSEQFHDAVVPHDLRVEESRQEKVIKAKVEMFERMRGEFGLEALPQPAPKVLFVLDMESLWAHEVPCQSQDFQPIAAIESLQRLFMARGYGVAMTRSLAAVDLAAYELVVLPAHAFALTTSEREALAAFVEGGGKALSLPRTGFKDRNGRMVDFPLELYGRDEFHFDDFGALLSSETERIKPSLPGSGLMTGRLWAEKIAVPADSPWRTLASFDGGLYAGSPAALARDLGRGRHLHLAFWPEISEDVAEFVAGALDLAPQWRLGVSGDLQLIPLQAGARRFVGALNFADESAPVERLTGASSRLVGLIAQLQPQLTLELERSTVDFSGNPTWRLPPRSVSLWECLP